jgi:thiol-disulfide isomerase/thioredoxin
MPARAQTVAANAPALALQGKTLTGAPFDIASTRGKVVVVFFWSAKCSVCLSHMPELRANLAGWRGKAFELVTANVDPDMADWQSYEQITARLEAVRPVAIWTGKAVRQKLPLTLVLNTKGQVIARHEGRIAPEAWDQVAEILP